MFFFYTALIPGCLFVYFLTSHFFGVTVFYDLIPHWIAFVIERFPGGLFFIPQELSLDAVVALCNFLGDIVGVIAACLAASVATFLYLKHKKPPAAPASR